MLGRSKVLPANPLEPCQNQQQKRRRIALTGVSAGALVSAALAAGVRPDDGMEAALSVAQRARSSGPLDAFQPGFSLIDVVDEHFGKLLRDAVGDDTERFLESIEYGKLLRIGLTDRRVFPPVGSNPHAFCYVERYNDMEDVIAACLLSSYIPGVTGPTWGTLDRRHDTLARAAERFNNMISKGNVTRALTGKPVDPSSNDDKREVGWDGGLVNGFPYIDEHTIIVSPLAADFTHGSISPALDHDGSPVRSWAVTDAVRMHMTYANMVAFRFITLSSDEKVLQEKYQQGYDNTKVFLASNNLIAVQQHQSTGMKLEGQVEG